MTHARAVQLHPMHCSWHIIRWLLSQPPNGSLLRTEHGLHMCVHVKIEPAFNGTAYGTMQDCHAMGASPVTALAIAVVPYGLESKTEADLHQMMAGAVGALSEAGCMLVGGHTSEGADMALGESLIGSSHRALS